MSRKGYSDLLMWALLEKKKKGMSANEIKSTYDISNDSIKSWLYRTMMENGQEEEAAKII